MVTIEAQKLYDIKSLDQLRQVVEENEGVLTITMEHLRDAHGAGRLGVHVRTSISKALLGRGLGHFPEELPAYQENPVRIYKLGSRVADLIDAVLKPNPDNDEQLRRAGGGDAEAVLDNIRALVCE